eukprot:8138930-Lingulodinium_polyedra.AAC.1
MHTAQLEWIRAQLAQFKPAAERLARLQKAVDSTLAARDAATEQVKRHSAIIADMQQELQRLQSEQVLSHERHSEARKALL